MSRTFSARPPIRASDHQIAEPLQHDSSTRTGNGRLETSEKKEDDVYERGTENGRHVYSIVLSGWLMTGGRCEIDGRNMEIRSSLLRGERG